MGKSELSLLFSSFENAAQINSQNLQRILQDNRDTEFGRKYNFSSIHSVEAFRKKVPLTRFSDYGGYDASCSYERYCFLNSSGTTGTSKKLGLSQEALKRYGSWLFDVPAALSDLRPGRILHVNIFRPIVENSILSEAYYHYYMENGILSWDSFLGGKACMVSGETVNTFYVKLWLALACPELEAIFSTFRYDVLLMMNQLRTTWKNLLQDMERGIPSEPLPEPIRQTLMHAKISQNRLKFLRREFQQGFNTPILPRIFPKLKLVGGIGGQLFRAYDQALKAYTGEIPCHYFAYGQSECLCGIAAEMNSDVYTLLPSCGFFEFQDIESGEVLLPGQVEIGKRYELVLTSFSGLYRYQNGDVVEITGFHGQAPKMRICDRLRHVLNIDGEKLTESEAAEAVERLLEELELPFNTYYVGIDSRTIPSVYVLLLDLPAPELAPDPGVIAEKLDEILKEKNWDYQDLRRLSLIGMPRCCLISHAAVEQLQGGGQSKPGIILSEEKIQSFLSSLQQDACSEKEAHSI